MSEEETLKRLYDLIDDRNSFITEDEELSEPFIKDKQALEMIIGSYEHNKVCLAGYRQAMLNRGVNLVTLEDEYVKLQQEKQALIKYLEDKIKECEQYLEYQAWRSKQQVYQEILDRVKENK